MSIKFLCDFLIIVLFHLLYFSYIFLSKICNFTFQCQQFLRANSDATHFFFWKIIIWKKNLCYCTQSNVHKILLSFSLSKVILDRFILFCVILLFLLLLLLLWEMGAILKVCVTFIWFCSMGSCIKTIFGSRILKEIDYWVYCMVALNIFWCIFVFLGKKYYSKFMAR